MENSPRIAFLDFARGFAMTTIVAFHCLQPFAREMGAWGSLLAFGGAGVHAFLFLSGFGLALSGSPQSYRTFYTRRLQKVLIPYFGFVTLVFLLNLGCPLYRSDGLYAYLGHLLLFKMFDESIITSFGYPLWFMSTIIQFYLIFPGLDSALTRWGPRRFLSGACVISLAFMTLTIVSHHSDERVLSSSCIVYLWEFALGMVAAKRFVGTGKAFWQLPGRHILPWTALGLVMTVALAHFGGSQGRLLNNPCSLLGYGGLVILAFQASGHGRQLGLRNYLVGFSAISYETFLVHGLVVELIFQLLDPPSALAKLLLGGVAFSASILAGQTFARLLRVERPRVRPRVRPQLATIAADHRRRA